MKEQIWINRDFPKCSGCRRCEIACSVFHEGKIWPEASRVRVFMLVPGVEIPHLCYQCEGYPCVESCQFNALSIDDGTGAVIVDKEKCTACGACIEACPGNIPHLHPESKCIVICDLCGGRPRCVEACQEGAWNALTLVRRRRAQTPEEITREVAEQLFGKETAKEVVDQ